MNETVFTRIAPVYDRMNRLLSAGMDGLWRGRLVGGMSGSPRRIVDLAAGTGEVSRRIARRFPQAEVLALDLDEAMLAEARAKRIGGNVTFRRMDARVFASAVDRPVDAVTCAFGFRNFPDAEGVLRECRKVLPAGGELALLEFFRIESRVLGWCVRAWTLGLSFVLSAKRRASYRYLCESMRQTHEVSEFVALAGRCGFRLVRRSRYFPCCTHLVFVRR